MVFGVFEDSFPLFQESKRDVQAIEERLRDVVSHLHEELGNAVYHYLLVLELPSDQAEDLCQECFLELYMALSANRRIERVRNWLFSVAYKLAVDAKTDARRQQQRIEPLTEEKHSYWSDDERNPEEQALDDERLMRVRTAMNGLSARQRRCLYLRAEGLRHREIAALLNISPKTVAEFLRRAISQLQKVAQ